MENIRKQVPTTADNWLYQDQEETREFRKLIFLGKDAQEWAECTNEEKEEWEAAHPQPIPDDIDRLTM